MPLDAPTLVADLVWRWRRRCHEDVERVRALLAKVDGGINGADEKTVAALAGRLAEAHAAVQAKLAQVEQARAAAATAHDDAVRYARVVCFEGSPARTLTYKMRIRRWEDERAAVRAAAETASDTDAARTAAAVAQWVVRARALEREVHTSRAAALAAEQAATEARTVLQAELDAARAASVALQTYERSPWRANSSARGARGTDKP
jgi:hypothetical protein